MEVTRRPEIYADFQNADAQGRVRLNYVGTVNDLSRQQVQLREGLGLLLYSDDADADGRDARLVSEAIVSYSQDEQCWVASIDWRNIRREMVNELPISKSPSGAVLADSQITSVVQPVTKRI